MLANDDNETDADVIELRPGIDTKDEQRTLVIARDTSGRRCFHGLRFRLDPEARKVYCRDCGTEITAFSALEALARDMERFIYARQEAARRARVAQDELKLLQREERNAKARIRNAASRLAVCECEPTGRWIAGRWCPTCGGVRKAST